MLTLLRDPCQDFLNNFVQINHKRLKIRYSPFHFQFRRTSRERSVPVWLMVRNHFQKTFTEQYFFSTQNFCFLHILNIWPVMFQVLRR